MNLSTLFNRIFISSDQAGDGGETFFRFHLGTSVYKYITYC